MSDLEFATPVFIRSGAQRLEVDGVPEALTFMMSRPKALRGSAFDFAVSSCEGALDGVVTAAEAQDAFATFVDMSRLAAPAMMSGRARRVSAHPSLAH